MSGSAMSDWAISHHPLQATMQLLNQLNCPLRDDNEEMLTCLRKKRYQDILQSQVMMPEFTTTFGPVVDQLVVPNEPQNIMKNYAGVFSRFVFHFHFDFDFVHFCTLVYSQSLCYSLVWQL